MAARGHRRQVLLFLVAIILPCVVLVVLGLQMLAQERELGEKRLADERRAITSQLRQELSAQLDRIAREEAAVTRGDPRGATTRDNGHRNVALVAAVTNGHLLLPWERDPGPARFRRLLDEGEFARLVAQGEHAEINARPGEAAALYGEALTRASSAAARTYARLLRARARMAAGQGAEARRDYSAVIDAGRDITDEHGVPLALYAAVRLLEMGVERDTIRACIASLLRDRRWLSPAALYLLRDLARGLGSTADSTVGTVRDVGEEITARIMHVEQAIALQRDFPRLGLTGGTSIRNGEARWIPYGRPVWLVGRAASMGNEGEAAAVAIWADSLFDAVKATVLKESGSEVQLAVAAGDEPDEVLLGAAWPGVGARFGPVTRSSQPGADLRRWFYAVALILVVSIALFGAYFVSRDVRRELRLAEMRSRFVSAVSHELKTPLTAIRMFAETLQLGRAPSREIQAEYLETIVSESERLTRLLNNVLDFSKIERGRKEYLRSPTDLAGIVGAAARAMQYPLAQQQFALTLEIEEDLPMVNVDRDAIEQAVLNLLANAMKYSGEGRAIDLRLARTDGHAVIEVVDRGVGVAPEEQSRIFEQFYRGATKETEGIPGTGLGLTLVRHIAEGHGGTVTVQSVPGAGSTFAIRLPLKDGDA